MNPIVIVAIGAIIVAIIVALIFSRSDTEQSKEKNKGRKLNKEPPPRKKRKLQSHFQNPRRSTEEFRRKMTKRVF